MSLTLLGYNTRGLLRACARTRVYELERRDDGRRVIAKVFPAEGSEAQVRQELALLESLDIRGVVKPLGLERVEDNLVLLLERVDGRDLRSLTRGRPMAVADFLPVAIQLTEILAQVHERGIIHRDVKPSNVLVETQSNAVVLADFGISKLLEDEKHHLHEPEVFTGTLPYLSPEQSGRTARPVDYRSDLYSLGVSFYELLSGRLPFERSSPLELLHAHLARRPTPLQERRADLPALLSAMVMKLLEKAPERRYQTARGLLADLEQLAAALAAGSGEPDFPLGRRDRSPKLHFARLYGRDREQAILEQTLARLSGTAAGKTLQLITIEGEAGLGKSALIRQLEAPVLAAGGYLALGSHSAGGGPHSGLVAAFEALFQQVLTEDDQSLATWRRRLRGALGALAPVIAALVPSAELVLGELEPARALEPAEARNRLYLAISRLVTSVAAIAPLVLVIEDVQLADAASRELMTALMAEADTPALLLLSLRPSPEVEAWLEKHLPAKASRLRLQPLTEAQLHALLADTLDRAPEDLGELAALVGRKTGNNPWLIQQFLVHLEALRLLEADADGWRWDPAKLAELSLPEGLVGVLEARLALLPADARRLLCQAAHIGPSFDLELLAAVAELEDEPLFAALRTLESAGVIDRRPGGYRFADLELLHVARDFADQGESRALHARIGAEILGRHDIEEGALGGEWLFEAADHLEAGDPAAVAAVIGRKQLARLNFAAGQRAFDGADWDTARRYFAAAYDRLKPEVTTASTGGLSMSAAVATGLRLAQSLTLIGDHEDAKTLFETLEGWQLSEDEAAELVARRVQSELLSGHYQQAMARGLAALRRQGIEIPARISKLDIGIEVFRRWRDIHEVSREDWLARPMADDVGTINLSRLIAAIKSVAYLADKPLFVLLSGIHVRVAAGPALDELGALALAELAISVAFGLRKPEAAAVLCEHALALCERPAMAPTRPRIEAAALLFIWPCSRPWRRYVDRLPQLVDRLSEGGNRQLGGFAAVIGISQLWISGQPLSRVLEQGREWSTLVSRWGTPEVTLGCAKTLRLVELLIGERTSFDELIDSEQGRAVEASPIFGPTTVMCRMIAAVLLGEPQRVYDELDTIVDDFEQILFGSWQAPRLAMWAALVDASRLEAGCDAGMRRRLRARLRRYEALVSRWARSGPENFGAMLELVRAERAQVRGRVGRAQAGYERAREHARTQRNPMLEGLANLRLAELAERSGQPVLAHGARSLASQAFRRWGAKAVVERLERELAVADDSATFGGESTIDDGSGRQPMLTTATTSNANLDLSTVLEVVTSIGEALDFGEVVGRVLAGAVSHAGADRGLLLLEQDGAVRVIADERADERADEGADDQGSAVATGTILADYRDDRGTELAPTSAVNYVLRTGTTLILDDARSESRFAGDPYMQSSGVCSLLCMPIIKQGERVGALLLENHLATHAFTRERLAVLQAIVAQAAGALENARLYGALQSSEARWRSLVDGAPDTILVMDRRGRVEFCNHFSEVGEPEQLLGEGFEELLEPEHKQLWRTAITKVAMQARVQEVEVAIVARNGTRHDYLVRVAPVDADRGRLLAIVTEISERRNLEGQVRQQQRLESIGTLASGVAHEINNPIQGIMNYAELIAGQAEGNELVREFAGEINDEAERVAEIVRNLLTFARQEPESGDEWVEVDGIVNSTLTLIHALLRKDGVQLDVEIAEKLPRIRCRPQQIRQVVMNLLTNARDALNEAYPYYDDNKRIALRVDELNEIGQRWVRFSVEDRGPGIPDEILAQIFDPFFTTKGRDKGTGLGLAVSHGIASEHGGRLDVDSEVGVGTTFSLLLPIEVPRFELTEDLLPPPSLRRLGTSTGG